MLSEDEIRLLGASLFLHDFDDVGQFDRLHHWIVGAAMLIGAAWITKNFD